MPQATTFIGLLRSRLRRSLALAAPSIATALSFSASALESGPPCTRITFKENRYTLCRFDAATGDLRLHHKSRDGIIYGGFERLQRDLASQGEKLRFAMNAGMYHADQSPVGLLIIGGTEKAPLNEGSGYGNFYLKPNGVFAWGNGKAAVLDTAAYRKANLSPAYATQSGPMLLIGGKIHPRFLTDATSRNIRNGVGVAEDGRTVLFVISDTAVTFHEFATLFRDELKTPDALYLDGSISQLLSTDLGRADKGTDLGPILSVIESPRTPEPEGRTSP